MKRYLLKIRYSHQSFVRQIQARSMALAIMNIAEMRDDLIAALAEYRDIEPLEIAIEGPL
jgi:hypothetical protein